MRTFNTSGTNIINKHYTLPRLEWVAKGKDLVYDDRYFTIWAPRQTGKTTYFQLLADTLREEGYKVCYINFENYKNATLNAFTNTLTDEMKRYWQKDF